MKYQPYPEYKDSGVEWLDKVPRHWNIGCLGRFGKFIGGSGFPHEEQGSKKGELPFYKVSDANLEGNEVYLKKSENYISMSVAQKLRATICPAGGIMFPKVGAALLGNKRRILTRDSITDNNTMVYYPSNGKSKYWYYWLSILDFGQISNPGPVPSVNEGQLKDFIALYPPENEQAQITTFLDRETQKIDRLIEKQQQLIKLLQEKRQAVISHAITKGLNPNVKMKESGVEWLGEIPEHWRCGSIRWYIVISSGEALSNSKFIKDQDKSHPFRVVGGNGTLGYTFRINTKQKAIVIGRVGALCGNVHFIDEECWVTDNALKISSWKGFLDKYLYYMLRAARLNEHASKTAQPLITGNQVKSLKVVFPSMQEQQQIVSFIESNGNRIDRLIEKCENAIRLMKERRTALISAAVTGKIDVRNMAVDNTYITNVQDAVTA